MYQRRRGDDVRPYRKAQPYPILSFHRVPPFVDFVFGACPSHCLYYIPYWVYMQVADCTNFTLDFSSFYTLMGIILVPFSKVKLRVGTIPNFSVNRCIMRKGHFCMDYCCLSLL